MIARITRNLVNTGAVTPTESLPSQYVVDTALTWIAWDAPLLVYPGIDISYKMTGYDWFNRALSWSIDSGPGWLSIGSGSGIFTGTPPGNGSESVTVRMTPAGGTAVTKTFTMVIDSTKCKFVDDTGGSDSADGSLATPYATVGKAMDVTSASPTGGWSIYVKAGSYTESWPNNVSWWGQDFTASAPLTVRSYPGESVTINNVAKGFGTFQNYVVYYDFDIVGGTESENSCLGVNFKNVAKLINASGFRAADVNNNPTGFASAYDCVLDSCTSEDNYAVGQLGVQNNSNYLHYCDKADTGLEAFYIDCIGSGQSVVNFKLKHSGADRVHYHRCVAYGCPNGFDVASNWSTVRHCLGVGDQGFAVGNRGVLNYGGSSGTNNDLGLLFDACLSIAEAGENAADMGYGGSSNASNCPVFRDLTVVATTATSGVENWPLRRQSYGSPQPSPTPRKVVDCVIYSPANSNSQLNATDVDTILSIAAVNSEPECSGNTHAGALGSTELTYQAAGYNWSYTTAGGLVQGGAL